MSLNTIKMRPPRLNLNTYRVCLILGAMICMGFSVPILKSFPSLALLTCAVGVSFFWAALWDSDREDVVDRLQSVHRKRYAAKFQEMVMVDARWQGEGDLLTAAMWGCELEVTPRGEEWGWQSQCGQLFLEGRQPERHLAQQMAIQSALQCHRYLVQQYHLLELGPEPATPEALEPMS